LQKVTYKTRNINNGRAASRIGAKKFAAPSKAGIKAKTRYNKLPVAIDTGSVHSFINCMILLIFIIKSCSFSPFSEREWAAKLRKKTENQQYNSKIVNMIKTNSEFTIIEYIN
jgi:hypothetical protein